MTRRAPDIAEDDQKETYEAEEAGRGSEEAGNRPFFLVPERATHVASRIELASDGQVRRAGVSLSELNSA